MDWAIDHAPKIAGALVFCLIVYLLVEQMLTRKNSDD